MRVDVNLASRPLVNRLPHVILLVTLGLTAVGLTAWNAVLFWTTRKDAQAKSLGEWLRSRLVEVPEVLLTGSPPRPRPSSL